MRSTRMNLAAGMSAATGLFFCGGTAVIGQDSPTTVSELIAYGLDNNSRTLVRYDFETNTHETVGPIRLPDGTVLSQVESLAYLPHSLHAYSVWNYSGAGSRLVRIHLLTGEATILSSDLQFGNVEGLTAVSSLNRGPGPGSPTQVTLNDSDGNPAFEVTFVDVTYNDDGTSSWTYNVRELEGGKDLSHWNLALDECHTVTDGTTAGYEVGVDGSTGFYGIKWDVDDAFSEGEFTIVFDQHFAGTEGGQGVGVLAKGGRDADSGEIFGPTCNVPLDEVLYGVHSDDDGRQSLISINPESGSSKIEMEISRRYEGFAADKDGKLFAVSNNELYRLDPFADEEAFIGAGDFHDIESISWCYGDDSPSIEVPGLDPEYWSDGLLVGFSDYEDAMVFVHPTQGTTVGYQNSMEDLDVEGLIIVTQQSDPTYKILASAYD